jgi:hypothetical protein
MTTDPGAMSPWPFSIKRVFKDTFRVLRGNLRGCVVVTVAYIALWHLAFWLADDPSEGAFSWWNFAVGELLATVIWGLASAVLTYVVLLTLSGIRPSLRDLMRGLSFAVPVVVVLLICGLPGMVSRLIGAAEPSETPSLVPQIAIGLAGCILAAFWFAAAPAVVAEGLGPLAALRRSTALTAGSRWPIFGLLFAIGIIFWAMQWAIWHLGNAVNAEVGHTGPNLVFWFGDYVFPAIGLVFWSVLQTVAYAALRLAKEGAGALELARVFD